MSDDDKPPATRLWTQDGFRDDEWVHVGDADEALASNSRAILPLAAYVGLGETARDGAADRLGVLVAPGESLDALTPHLGRLPLVALAFPAFSDGRSYSKAELLRTRHAYRGAIRASGDVLIDQIPLMIRTGFTEFEVTNETALRRLEEGRLGGIPFHYQPTARPGVAGAGYSWRRRPAV